MVPRKVIRWAMHKFGVQEWLVSAATAAAAAAAIHDM